LEGKMSASADLKSAQLSGEAALERSMEIMRDSVREGTHSDKSQHVCGVCREWCDAIWYVNEQGTRLCAGCADKINQGPASLAARGRK
jgi:hypothetical protein